MELSEHSSPARPPVPDEARGRPGWNLLTTPLGVGALFVASLLAFGWLLAWLNTSGEARLTSDPLSTHIVRELLARQALAFFVPAGLAFLIWRTSPRVVRRLAVAAGVFLVCLQATDHRIYGRVILEDPVASAKEHLVVALEAPNLLITADGEQLPLDGIAFTAAALALTPSEIARQLDLRDADLIVSAWPRPMTPPPGYTLIQLENPPSRSALAWRVFLDEDGPRRPPYMLFPMTMPSALQSDVGRDMWARGLATWHGKTWEEVTGPRR